MGIIFCLSGPSGSGKTTLANALSSRVPKASRIITVTTREPRLGEEDGKDYHFWSHEKFKEGIEQGFFFEHENVYGRLYGTLKKSLTDVIENDAISSVVLDVNGALKLRKEYPDNVVNIFVTCAFKNELYSRLKHRGTSQEEMSKRLASVNGEHATYIAHVWEYDYLLLNNSFSGDYFSFFSIIQHELLKSDRGEDFCVFV